MRKFSSMLFGVPTGLLFLVSVSYGSAQGPAYASESAKQIISKMIDAHGGMKKWNTSQALSFSHLLVFGEPLGTEFWLSHETTEIKTERAYQDWPIFNGRLAFDGKKIWTQNWKLDNPPGANLNNIYHAMAMVWLTQRKEVILEELPRAKLFHDTTLYYVVKLTYSKESKESPHKYYKLFIHPVSHLLSGLEFNITYAPFLDLIGLPKDQKSIGPFTHVFYTYTSVDGMIFPEKYDTFDGNGHNSGRHIAFDFSLDEKFDTTRMKVPPDALVDNATSDR